MSIHDTLTDAILRAEEEVAQKESDLRAAKTKLREAENDLIGAIEDGTVPDKFQAHNKMWRIDTRLLVTPETGEADRVIAWIKEHGGEDLVKPTMHAQSRDKFLRDTLIDQETGEVHIPPELDGKIKETVLTKIAKR